MQSELPMPMVLGVTAPAILGLPQHDSQPTGLKQCPDSHVTTHAHSLISKHALNRSYAMHRAIYSRAPTEHTASLARASFLATTVNQSFCIGSTVNNALHDRFWHLRMCPAPSPPCTRRPGPAIRQRFYFPGQLLTPGYWHYRYTGARPPNNSGICTWKVSNSRTRRPPIHIFFISRGNGIGVLTARHRGLPSLLARQLLKTLRKTARHRRQGKPTLFRHSHPRRMPRNSSQQLCLHRPRRRLLIRLLPNDLNPRRLKFLLTQ